MTIFAHDIRDYGTGIGLALSRQMMVMQGGNLTLSESPIRSLSQSDGAFQSNYHVTFHIVFNNAPGYECTD